MDNENSLRSAGAKFMEKALAKSQQFLSKPKTQPLVTGTPENESYCSRMNDRRVKTNHNNLMETEINSEKFLENQPEDSSWRNSVLKSDNLARRPLRPDVLNENENSTAQIFEKCAICKNCGGLSREFQFCDRCNKLLPKNAKTYNRVLRQDNPKKNSPISTNSFYAKKIKEKFYHRMASETEKRRSKERARQLRRRNEPVCLTLSSDEDEQHNNSLVGSDNSQRTSVIAYAGSKDTFTIPRSKRLLTETDSNSQIMLREVELKCRSVRIGSFKYITETPAVFSVDGITLEAMSIFEYGKKEIVLHPKDLVKILFHFGFSLNVLFIYTTPGCAASVRTQLRMNKTAGPYFEPCGKDDTEKRITILPIKVSEEDQQILRGIFSEYGRIRKISKLIQEISDEQANEILVKSTPTHVKNIAKMFVSSPELGSKQCIANYLSKTPMKTIKMMTYPPPPQTGGITITSDDFSCLLEGEFLNDVIIDFYLKYLVQNELSERDKNRTHVFSSFFYPRLTQRATRKNGPTQDPPLPQAEMRHNRVKTWTRHADIFDKDFIIIPINEKAHWFLAIICFPYLDGPVILKQSDHNPTNESVDKPFVANAAEESDGELPMEGDDERSTPNSEASANVPLTNSEEDNFDEETFDANQSESNSPKKNCLQPCILIFDSLPGPNRSRIVSALRDYLRVEWKAKKKTVRQFDKFTMRGGLPKVPQQSNHTDCGVYLLQYVESFFKDPPQDFSEQCLDLRHWFTDEQVSSKRRQLQALIYNLMLQQNGKDVLSDEGNEDGMDEDFHEQTANQSSASEANNHETNKEESSPSNS